MLARRQSALDFGPAAHFALLHGQHDHPIYSAVKGVSPIKKGQTFTEKRLEHESAPWALETLASSGRDSYLTLHGFNPQSRSRRATSVDRLTVLAVDLDYYKRPDLQNLTPDELLNRILRAYPELPLPTAIEDSGQGAWLLWAFPYALDAAAFLPEWQYTQNQLAELLKPYGADGNCTDASRYTRLGGSINSRSGRMAGLRTVGESVPFETMRRAVDSIVKARFVAAVPGAGRAGRVALDESPRQKRHGTNEHSKLDAYRLHADRLADLQKLVELRGGILRDHRRRMMYVRAVSLCWYCGDEQAIRDDLNGFSGEHFADPDSYGDDIVAGVIRRLRERGVVAGSIHRGRIQPHRITLRNSTIIRLLDITPEEQRGLRTIIGKAEKSRRQEQRRRDQGMEARPAITARKEARRTQAVELRASGLTQATIAARLGVTQAYVSQLLAGKR